MFRWIDVGNGVLDSDMVLSAQELKGCHGLFVNEKQIAICNETNAIKPFLVKFENRDDRAGRRSS